MRRASARAVLSLVAVLGFPCCSSQRSAVLGFWFEDVTYSSSRLGGGLSAGEMETIAGVARTEITEAFTGLRVTLSDRRDARYRVRVVQQLRDPSFRGDVGVAGASRAISMFGGDGAVNFSVLAAYADVYAPPEVDRTAIVAAIGRGIGRAAVHEFLHQLLGSDWFDTTEDRSSYEFGSAARQEQYYGRLHWGAAWPVLQRRFGGAHP